MDSSRDSGQVHTSDGPSASSGALCSQLSHVAASALDTDSQGEYTERLSERAGLLDEPVSVPAVGVFRGRGWLAAKRDGR
jgi:hypothetical protein